MDSNRHTPPKRHREDDQNGYGDSPPRKRSPNGTSPYASRRYSRTGDRDADLRYYRDRRPSRSPSPARSQSRSQSRTPSRDRHRHRSRTRTPSSTPPPPKPTTLNYAPVLILRGHKKGVSCVKFSPDGRWIASASSDCTIKLWSAQTGKLEHTLEGHLAGISTISWSPDSRLLASGSDDKSIRLWDVATGQPHPTPFNGHHNYVYSIAFSPKGNMLVSGSYDEAVYLWDVRAARVMRSLPAHSDPVSGVDFVRDGTLITSCSHDGLIRVWDTATGQCLRTLVHEDNAPVTGVKFSPNGKYVLAWTLDSCIRLWNYIDGKGKCVKTYQGHVNKKHSLEGAFGTYGGSSDGMGRGSEEARYAFVASGSEDNDIVLWDVSSKNVLQRLKGHSAPPLSVDTHPTEEVIASGGLDRTVRVWRVRERVEGEMEVEPPSQESVEAPERETEPMDGLEMFMSDLVQETG
ncbi:WD40 repeat-like protein, partial [Amniculicola lignicola CBS 123094]